MQPKFRDQITWTKAELLMQPILIRVIDNLRKAVDNSQWQGKYQEIETPLPGYQLILTKDHSTVKVDIWQLCFQICFSNYPLGIGNEFVEIDANLIEDTGEISWEHLEAKTKGIINNIFSNLS